MSSKTLTSKTEGISYFLKGPIPGIQTKSAKPTINRLINIQCLERLCLITQTLTPNIVVTTKVTFQNKSSEIMLNNELLQTGLMSAHHRLFIVQMSCGL